MIKVIIRGKYYNINLDQRLFHKCFFQMHVKVKVTHLQINEVLNMQFRTIFICFVGISFTSKNQFG